MDVGSTAATLAKNKLESDAPFLLFAEATHESLGAPIRLVRNTESLTWRGVEWQAFPIQIENSYTEDGKTIPSLTLKMPNVGGIIQTYLQKYGGLVDALVNLYVVYAENLDVEAPEMELGFQIKSTTYDEQWVSFTLGSSPEITNRFPAERYINDFCPYRFKDIRCGYAGGASECNNTLAQCRIPDRFGGEPGIPRGAY